MTEKTEKMDEIEEQKKEEKERKKAFVTMDQVFARMQVIYGYTWTNQHKTEAEWRLKKSEWMKALSDITVFQMKGALEFCAREKTRLPTLPEFRAIAKSIGADPLKNTKQEEEIDFETWKKAMEKKHPGLKIPAEHAHSYMPQAVRERLEKKELEKVEKNNLKPSGEEK